MKKHLTLSERAIIEKCIAQDMTFASIARKLERSPSTISKEVLKHRYLSTRNLLTLQGNAFITRPAYVTVFVIPDQPTPVWIVVNFVLMQTAGKSVSSMNPLTASF